LAASFKLNHIDQWIPLAVVDTTGLTRAPLSTAKAGKWYRPVQNIFQDSTQWLGGENKARESEDLSFIAAEPKDIGLVKHNAKNACTRQILLYLLVTCTHGTG
jgi:hypothetical protein